MSRIVAFGLKADLQPHIEAAIDRAAFQISFRDFATARLEDADLAVPLTLRDMERLCARGGTGRRNVLLPAPAAVALCHDKRALNERLLAGGCAGLVPPLCEGGESRLPYMLKRRRASSGQDSFIIRTREEEAAQAERLASDAYFRQAYIDSPLEYATHMLVAGGRLVYHSTNQYWMPPHAVKGTGSLPVREIMGFAMAEGVIAELAEAVRSIGFEGVCCVDYKIQEGRMWLLEINPRFGFTLYRDINRFLAAYAAALDAR